METGIKSGVQSWMATQLAKKIARTPLSDPMSGFFIMRQEIFAAIDALRNCDRKDTKFSSTFTHARSKASVPRVRLGEVGYEFGERHCGQSKFTTKVALQFLAMLLELRFAPPACLRLSRIGSHSSLTSGHVTLASL